MPEIKHTPGPWYAWDNGDGLMGVGKLHGDQADLFRSTPASRRPAEEDRANLKVSAAAPDLLADLREAAATLRRYEALHRAKGTDDSAAKAEVNAALAMRFEVTIAKATD